MNACVFVFRPWDELISALVRRFRGWTLETGFTARCDIHLSIATQPAELVFKEISHYFEIILNYLNLQRVPIIFLQDRKKINKTGINLSNVNGKFKFWIEQTFRQVKLEGHDANVNRNSMDDSHSHHTCHVTSAHKHNRDLAVIDLKRCDWWRELVLNLCRKCFKLKLCSRCHFFFLQSDGITTIYYEHFFYRM